MANLDKAYLAVIQRFRDYYKNNQDHKIALRPISAIDTPIVEYISTETWNDQNAKYENEYLVAARANEVIKQAFTYTDNSDDLGVLYESMLESSETTNDLANRYLDAKEILTTRSKTVPLTLASYPITNLSAPTWTEEVIEESEFDSLVAKANTNPVFMAAFNASFGQANDQGDVKKVVFKKAEVSIIRPWLDEILLQSRDWRLKEHKTLNGKDYLSTSSTDYTGAVPGYPTKFILVKDIEIHFRVGSEPTDTEQEVGNGRILQFGNLLLNGGQRINSSTFKVQGLTASQSSIRAIKYTDKISTSEVKLGDFYKHNATLNLTLLNTRLDVTNIRPTRIDTTVISPSRVEINRPVITNIRPHIGGFRPVVSIASKVIFEVKKPNGQPVQYAELVIRKADGKNHKDYQKVKTNDKGIVQVQLLKNTTYDIAITKKTFKALVKQIKISNRASEKRSFKLKKNTTTSTTHTEQETNIQVLGIVYRKLEKIPNPVPNFQPAGHDF